jgi:hypothetical protein
MAKPKAKALTPGFPVVKPTQIKVGALIYTVHWTAEEWMNRPDVGRAEGDWALTNHPKLGIWIWPELNEQNKRGTLLHEALHTLFAVSGADVRNAINAAGEGFDVEEYTISRIENPLLSFLIDNPEVVAYIMIGEQSEPTPEG